MCRCLAVFACTVLAACTLPPVNPGFVSTVPRRGGALDLGLQGGAGLACVDKCSDGLGWGSLHLDPYLTPRLSVPVEGAVTDLGGKLPAEAARLGLRYRYADGASLGVGTGPTFVLGGGQYGATFDVEGAVGAELGDVGAVSIALRPTYARGPGDFNQALYLPVELAAMLELGSGVGLTAHLGGGAGLVSDPVRDETLSKPGVAFGAGAGVVWRIESLSPTRSGSSVNATGSLR